MTRLRLSDATDKKLFLNTAHVFFSFFFPTLTIMYVSRILQPEGLGTITFAISIVSYFSLFASVGIPNYAFRICAENRESKPKLSLITRELILLGLLFAAIAYAALAGTVFLLPVFSRQKTLFLLLGLGMFFSALRCDWFLCGTESWKYRTLSSIFFSAVALLLTVLFIKEKEDYIIYGMLTLAAPILCAVCNQFFIHRKLPKSGCEDAPLKPLRHLRASLRFLMMSCMVNIYSQLDIVMLGFISGNVTVGYYGIASKIKTVFAAISGIIWNVNLPQAVKHLSERDYGALQRITTRSMKLVLFLQLPIFAYSILYSRELVSFISGSEYAPAVLPLRILLFSLPPIAVSGIIGGQLLIPAGLEKLLLKSETIGVIVNLFLNAIMIPLFSMSGAAAATVIAEITVCVMAFNYSKKNLPIRIFDAKFLLKVLLLTGLSTCAGIFFRSLLSTYLSINSFFLLFFSAIFFGIIYLGMFLLWRRLDLSRKLLFYFSRAISSGKKPALFCPCCGKHLERFKKGRYTENPLVYNASRYTSTPQDVLCPFCDSIPRHRIIACWAEQNAELLRKSKILYFAPERSMQYWFKRNNIEIITADLFSRADLRLDITAIDLPEQSYDIVFCNHVLEHVSSYKKALSELYRIIRPGGMLLICFPLDPSLPTVFEQPTVTAAERIVLFGQDDHLRVFGQDSAELLAQAGFSVTTINIEDLPDNIRPDVGPADYDSNLIFICARP